MYVFTFTVCSSQDPDKAALPLSDVATLTSYLGFSSIASSIQAPQNLDPLKVWGSHGVFCDLSHALSVGKMAAQLFASSQPQGQQGEWATRVQLLLQGLWDLTGMRCTQAAGLPPNQAQKPGQGHVLAALSVDTTLRPVKGGGG